MRTDTIEGVANWTYVILPELQVYGVKTFGSKAGNFCGVLDSLGHVHNVSNNTVAVVLSGRGYHTLLKQAERVSENKEDGIQVQGPDEGTPHIQEIIEEAVSGTG